MTLVSERVLFISIYQQKPIKPVSLKYRFGVLLYYFLFPGLVIAQISYLLFSVVEPLWCLLLTAFMLHIGSEARSNER